MEVQDRSRSPSRRTSRVEQVVGRWLRRSRDLGSRSHSLSRDRAAPDGKAQSSGSDQRSYAFRFNVQIQRDPGLNSHGLTLSSQTPILVQEIIPGGPADGRLVPGDQLVKINNVAADDLTPEQAAEIIRECQETLTMTVLRTMLGPKSSFITPEKKAKLKCNPVKVRFAEEVEVNGQSQGNSLLFLPNVLKVYLENGQTKAFKFEPSTTVKDIVMTLKEKLSLSRIEHFSLMLEQQPGVTKLLLLHDEERIQQVVQKKEAHDYRCLFRVCFIPKTPQTLLADDPTAFEYLYLQGVNDVLQERFAVEMRCNTALRLAALHIQERLASCGQSPKTNLKMITKTWGIENFVSSTLLRNMREKDLRKAVGYHMKKCQSQYDPKQKGLTIDQARINYLEELSDLKSFGGKSFSATMMLQDRESTVTLLVGARYGVSQVVNRKLSILSTLTEFTSITRIELLPESDRVSLVKIYLQDIKPITLLLESVAAKDMSCLIAGYCRVFVDPNLNIFPWVDDSKKHRISAEEGYVSRCGSDSDSSSDLDMDPLVSTASQDEKPFHRVRSSSDPESKKRKDRLKSRSKDDKESAERLQEEKKEEKDVGTEKEKCPPDNVGEDTGTDSAKYGGQIHSGSGLEEETGMQKDVSKSKLESGEEVRGAEEQPSETSDSCHVLTSPSSDSLDALEEDDLISCSSSSTHPITSLHTHAHIHPPLQLHQYSQRPTHPHLLAPPPIHSHPVLIHPSTHIRGEGEEGGCRRSIDRADTQFLAPISGILCSDDSSLCFAELSRLVDFLPSPPEASEDDEDEDEELRRRREKVLREMDESMRRAGEGEGGSLSGEGTSKEHPLSVSPPTSSSHIDFVFNFDQSDARCYYNICSNITPDSARSLPHLPHHNERGGGEEKEEEAEGDEDTAEGLEHIPLLQPPPGFGDSSSDEEFFDARDRFTSPEDPTSGILPRDISTEIKLDFLSIRSLSDIRVSAADAEKGIKEEDRKAGNEKVGSRETLFQLRKRSRKRRSFMETEYTSRVSYPEQDAQSKQEIVSNKLHKSLLNEYGEAQTLSSDPEPSEQTRNPSPTVSSLTHSEGEPAQLESKPILSKPCSQGSLSEFGTHEKIRDPQTPSRTRKQEMEMEPDAMESKSVTDLVKAPSPTITVVRCRLDPDGKESANSRGDGKEEIDEGKARGEEEDTTCVSENGPFTSHMFLQRISEKDGKEKDAGEEQREGTKAYSSSSNRPLTSAKRQSEDTSATCLMDVNTKSGNGLLGTCLIALEQNSFVEEYMLEGLRDDPKPLSFSPPPPPPSSPLPPLPVNCISQSDCLEKEGGSKNPGTSIKVFLSTSEELQHSPEIQKRKGNHTDNAHLATTATVTEDELMGVVSSTMTASDEVTDSTSSDNVFDDDEASNSLNSSSSDKRYDWVIAGKNSVSANSEAEGKSNFQLSIKSCMSTNTEAHTRIRSVSPDYTRTINSIAAKLGAATSVPSSTFNSSAKLKSGDMFENINKAKSNSTPPGVAGMESLAISSLAKANMSTVHDVSKDPSSPTHFFFQTCSPSIMGRLSASTLRGKIQKLPLYLSRSQETINQAGVSTTPQSPVEDNSRETTEITISVTDINNVTQTINLDVGTTTESVDSDDSDTTVTGSEVDGEFFMETIPSKNSVFEEKGVTEPRQASFEISPSPVQTEPKHENQLFYTELDNSTPGPIRQPPATIVSSLQHNTSGLHMDTPGPIKNAPESKILFTELGEDVPGKITNLSLSIPPSIVVTTQNLNGPGLSFHSKTQKARQTSSDRPLIGLCRPSEQKLESANTFSSGCRVFTICKDLSQTKTPVEVGRPCLKSEVSCSSVLASGCESVVEGMQIPLDACGCPSVYTNCINEGDSFDEELTVYEFSCRTQSSGVPQMSGAGLPLMTTPPVHSFLSTSSTHSPSFSRSVLSSSSASELSPLLSPLSEASDSFLSQMHKETVNRLGQQRYPAPPAGFQVLRVDVDQLLSILESSSTDRSVASHRGRHPRETCPSHFTENKRVLQIEARRLMSGCQKVVGIGQSPEEMLHSLADSFRTLVELAGICLWFSGCDRCDRRNAEAVAGLADVARSFRDFCLAAERANSKRSCEDLSTKLLAKQCTALTASVFCLTQLFRTLTAL
ncbi:FERM and PDZ domain-containing protein 1 [Sphaeramia orbicularis]|uniref:FERM and PDZ domain-containing protein 1 n=1 Tax=Sphaeramia orbicularis TaxID=375764 RepID=UPI00118071C8|nr:FERM and PDZ domain-containing protein 1 [Sphaeramia orbicularis]XP_030000987.1 FERM and PDZ domain-containing protein 1 [Sphaeramia orbicularis]XP_030001071.1 FERM and PDZ domain-containing protein 1 [Sphaeramia orbicularis]